LRLALSAVGVAGAIARDVRPSVAFVTYVFGALTAGLLAGLAFATLAAAAQVEWSRRATSRR
jgi:hypothetical protein